MHIVWLRIRFTVTFFFSVWLGRIRDQRSTFLLGKLLLKSGQASFEISRLKYSMCRIAQLR
jgi:hypothetical protein